MNLGDLSPLANHLWQSTLFVAVVWLLTLALRRNRAQVRYSLWLAASIKFLIPFAALIALGRQFGWRATASIVQPDVQFVIDTVGQPFSRPGVAAITAPVTLSALVAALPMILLAAWFCGFAMHLLAWWVHWRRVAVIVREASPVRSGRELDAVRRFERIVGIRQAIGVVSSDASLEPGVFGIWQPVLLWPRTIGQRLADAQVDAIITHELCHVRRRDNLFAALHMVVEAICWFHPLVWWIEKRLVDERERACDEEVIRLGSDPQMYAESILKTCELYVESPLVCVAGVTGSNLRKRVEAIMRNEPGATLNTWRRLLLATVALVAVVGPVIFGVLKAPPLLAQTPVVTGDRPAFEVVSIKRNTSGDEIGGDVFQPGGRWNATNVTVRSLVRTAYRLQGFQIVGGPSWISAERFDITAKAAKDLRPPSSPDTFPEGLLMVQTLLAERFKVIVHRETRELPVYALVIARSDRKLGPRLRQPEIDCSSFDFRNPTTAPPAGFCGGIRSAPGTFTGKGATIRQLALNLSPRVGRIVLDRTGLNGSFDLDLEWSPSLPVAVSADPPTNGGTAAADAGASIFTAVQEQLGLKLESTKGPVDVLVIDSAEQPTPD
jgi:uncharacterized protein (TIGR03435 family)